MFHVFYKGNGAISQEFSVAGHWQLEEARLHLSAAGGASENYTITLVSAKGPEYGIVFNAADMNADADVQYKPTRPDPILPDDKLLFEYVNTNFQTWGLEIIYSLIK